MSKEKKEKKPEHPVMVIECVMCKRKAIRKRALSVPAIEDMLRFITFLLKNGWLEGTHPAFPGERFYSCKTCNGQLPVERAKRVRRPEAR